MMTSSGPPICLAGTYVRMWPRALLLVRITPSLHLPRRRSRSCADGSGRDASCFGIDNNAAKSLLPSCSHLLLTPRLSRGGDSILSSYIQAALKGSQAVVSLIGTLLPEQRINWRKNNRSIENS